MLSHALIAPSSVLETEGQRLRRLLERVIQGQIPAGGRLPRMWQGLKIYYRPQRLGKGEEESQGCLARVTAVDHFGCCCKVEKTIRKDALSSLPVAPPTEDRCLAEAVCRECVLVSIAVIKHVSI